MVFVPDPVLGFYRKVLARLTEPKILFTAFATQSDQLAMDALKFKGFEIQTLFKRNILPLLIVVLCGCLKNHLLLLWFISLFNFKVLKGLFELQHRNFAIALYLKAQTHQCK